jgi:hypothetical protein
LTPKVSCQSKNHTLLAASASQLLPSAIDPDDNSASELSFVGDDELAGNALESLGVSGVLSLDSDSNKGFVLNFEGEDVE